MPTPDEIATKYLSPRAIELDKLDRYISCTQYEGRVGWFDNTSDTPLFDRKPCVNYPIGKSAIGSHVSFVLGEGRWPTLTSATSEDDRELDPEWGLSEEDSDLFDRFVNVVLVKYAKLKQVAREMLSDAMGSRSVAVVCSVKSGQLFAETVRASWCTPTLDELGECTKLEIRYPYIEDFYNDEKKAWDKRCMLYRRVIDEKVDVVYVPAPGDPTGKEPEWKVDESKTREHGLGFCPVRWYPFMKPCSTVNVVDGVALHEHQLGEIDGLNIALSQKQRASVTAGDPQMVESGVAEGVNPAPMGEASRGIIDVKAAGPGGKPIGVFSSTPTGNRARRYLARKRGAGVIWRYPDKDSKVYYLTIPGDALKAIDEHARDLRAKIAEALSAVFIEPSELKMHAAMSGKALSFLFARQLAFDDQIREDFANKALIPLVSMLLRMILVLGRTKKGLYIPGIKRILPLLEGFERDVANDNGEATGGKTWMPPRLETVWGPYFAPNEQDQLFVVQLVCQALQGGTITTQQAVEKLSQSGVFEVGSAEEVVANIEEERAKRQKAALEQARVRGGSPPGEDGEGKSEPPAKKPEKPDEKEAA